MKRYIAIICAIMAALVSRAQCEIPLMTQVLDPQNFDIPMSSLNVLESRLSQALTMDGVVGGAPYSQFCVVAQVNPIQSEAISGLQKTYMVAFNLDLFVGSIATGEKFLSSSIRLKGAGTSTDRAYTTAFNSINVNNKQFQDFVKKAKQKIIAYYDSQLNSIISRAKALCVTQDYEEALCLLSSVPTCCNGYNQVETLLASTFQSFVNYDCAVKVNKARAIWNATQNERGAMLAGAYLAAINPSSACNSDALILAEQIRSRVGDDWEFYKELKRESVNIEKARIEAARAIGVAYGENQKANTIRENWMVR